MLLTKQSHYSLTGEVADDVNPSAQGCSSGRACRALVSSAWSAASHARISGPDAFVLRSLSSVTGNEIE